MKKPRKPIPTFKTEAAERQFWEARDTDSTEYFVDAPMVRAAFPNLKASTTAISLRLPDALLTHIKITANRLDVPYQSLMKLWLSEKLAETEKRTP